MGGTSVTVSGIFDLHLRYACAFLSSGAASPAFSTFRAPESSSQLVCYTPIAHQGKSSDEQTVVLLYKILPGVDVHVALPRDGHLLPTYTFKPEVYTAVDSSTGSGSGGLPVVITGANFEPTAQYYCTFTVNKDEVQSAVAHPTSSTSLTITTPLWPYRRGDQASIVLQRSVDGVSEHVAIPYGGGGPSRTYTFTDNWSAVLATSGPSGGSYTVGVVGSFSERSSYQCKFEGQGVGPVAPYNSSLLYCLVPSWSNFGSNANVGVSISVSTGPQTLSFDGSTQPTFTFILEHFTGLDVTTLSKAGGSVTAYGEGLITSSSYALKMVSHGFEVESDEAYPLNSTAVALELPAWPFKQVGDLTVTVQLLKYLDSDNSLLDFGGAVNGDKLVLSGGELSTSEQWTGLASPLSASSAGGTVIVANATGLIAGDSYFCKLYSRAKKVLSPQFVYNASADPACVSPAWPHQYETPLTFALMKLVGASGVVVPFDGSALPLLTLEAEFVASFSPSEGTQGTAATLTVTGAGFSASATYSCRLSVENSPLPALNSPAVAPLNTTMFVCVVPSPILPATSLGGPSSSYELSVWKVVGTTRFPLPSSDPTLVGPAGGGAKTKFMFRPSEGGKSDPTDTNMVGMTFIEPFSKDPRVDPSIPTSGSKPSVAGYAFNVEFHDQKHQTLISNRGLVEAGFDNSTVYYITGIAVAMAQIPKKTDVDAARIAYSFTTKQEMDCFETGMTVVYGPTNLLESAFSSHTYLYTPYLFAAGRYITVNMSAGESLVLELSHDGSTTGVYGNPYMRSPPGGKRSAVGYADSDYGDYPFEECELEFTLLQAVIDLRLIYDTVPRDCNGTAMGTMSYDQCDVCGGSDDCVGCDGIANSGVVLDACGVCGGDNFTCMGCDGVLSSGLAFDYCQVCEGSSTCVGAVSTVVGASSVAFNITKELEKLYNTEVMVASAVQCGVVTDPFLQDEASFGPPAGGGGGDAGGDGGGGGLAPPSGGSSGGPGGAPPAGAGGSGGCGAPGSTGGGAVSVPKNPDLVNGNSSVARFKGPTGLAVDLYDNIFIADTSNNVIRLFSSAGIASTKAGASDTSDFADGDGDTATFQSPSGLALDEFGNLIVADTANHRIRLISPEGVVSTLAGTSASGYYDETGTVAAFSSPCCVAVNSDGTVYVADTGNFRIRAITPSGVVTTFAGSGSAGSADGVTTEASFAALTGIAMVADGTLYVTDSHRVRSISSAGEVTTIAGSDAAGYRDGNGTLARFDTPTGIAADASHNVYLADTYNNRVRWIDAHGVVRTVAGTGEYGTADGNGTASTFAWPKAITLDRVGNLYVADSMAGRIRRVKLVAEQAVPAAWACATLNYNSSDGCDCNCGTKDPDCAFDVPANCSGHALPDGTCVYCPVPAVFPVASSAASQDGLWRTSSAATALLTRRFFTATAVNGSLYLMGGASVVIEAAPTASEGPIGGAGGPPPGGSAPGSTEDSCPECVCDCSSSDSSTDDNATTSTNSTTNSTTTTNSTSSESNTTTSNSSSTTTTTNSSDSSATTTTNSTADDSNSTTTTNATSEDSNSTSSSNSTNSTSSGGGGGSRRLLQQGPGRLLQKDEASELPPWSQHWHQREGDGGGGARELLTTETVASPGPPSTSSATTYSPALTTEVQQCDATGTTCQALASMTLPRTYALSAALDGLVYVVGGLGEEPSSDSLLPLRSMEAFDPSTGAWWPKASLLDLTDDNPVSSLNAALLAVSGMLYLVAPFTPVATPSPTPAPTAPVPSPPGGGGGPGGGGPGGGGPPAGATTGSSSAPTALLVTIYHPSANYWSYLENTITPARQEFGAAVLGTTVYIVGGTVDYAPSNLVQAIDTSTGLATTMGSLTVARSGLSLTACSGRLYALAANSLELEEYDTNTDTWRVVRQLTASMARPLLVELDGQVVAVDTEHTSYQPSALVFTPPTTGLLELLLNGGCESGDDGSWHSWDAASWACTANASTAMAGDHHFSLSVAVGNTTAQLCQTVAVGRHLGIDANARSFRLRAWLATQGNTTVAALSIAFVDPTARVLASERRRFTTSSLATWYFAGWDQMAPPGTSDIQVCLSAELHAGSLALPTALFDSISLSPKPLGQLYVSSRQYFAGTPDGSLERPYLSLTDAISASADGDEAIIFLPGRYTGSSFTNVQFGTLNSSLIGIAGPAYTVFDLTTSGRAFNFSSDADYVSTPFISGLQFRGGSASLGGALYFSNGEPRVHDVVLERNYASSQGGAMYSVDAQVQLSWVSASNNFANGAGGFLYADGGGVHAAHCNASANIAPTGGAIYLSSVAGVVRTLAGTGSAEYTDGEGTVAAFKWPVGLAVHRDGRVFVGDLLNNRVRVMDTANSVTTLAGSGQKGLDDGIGDEARFRSPSGLCATDLHVYVADKDNHCIRRIELATSEVVALAGSQDQTSGFANADTGTAALFASPSDVAVDRTDVVFVADFGNHRIRSITPAGVVRTLAGSGVEGFADGLGTGAMFYGPVAVVMTRHGLLVADKNNHAIRRVSLAGEVTTLAGSGTSGYVDDIGTRAQFYRPSALAVDARQNVYVADTSNNRLRRITPAGIVVTVAGLSSSGSLDGQAGTALLNSPSGLALTPAGRLVFTDSSNHAVRELALPGTVAHSLVQSTITLTEGGVYAHNSAVDLLNVSLVNNDAPHGAALHVVNDDDRYLSVVVTNSTVSSNNATTSGAALYADTNARVVLAGTVLAGNRAEDGAACAFQASASVFMADTTLADNQASSASATSNGGACVHAAYSLVYLVRTRFHRNTAHNGGAAYVSENAYLRMRDCEFNANSVTVNGGALYMEPSSVVEVRLTRFGNDSALGSGGAMFAESATVLVEDSVFADCKSALLGGALYYDNVNLVAGISVLRSSFFGNSVSYGDGGAVLLTSITSAGYTTLTSSLFARNSAPLSSGGAVAVKASANTTLLSCAFESNSALEGGAVSLRGLAYVTLQASNLTANTAVFGGGCSAVTVSRLCVVASAFTANRARFGGGLLVGGRSSATLSASLFASNNMGNPDLGSALSPVLGGAVHFKEATTATFTDCRFLGNSGSSGGAVYTDGSSAVAFVGATFDANSAITAGGAAVAVSSSSLAVTSSLFSRNSVSDGAGGAVLSDGGAYSVSSSQFANNSASGFGGATSVLHADFAFTNVSFVHNAGSFGGALHVATHAATSELVSLRFDGNTASNGGGAFFWTLVTLDMAEPVCSSCVYADMQANVALYGPDRATGAKSIALAFVPTVAQTSGVAIHPSVDVEVLDYYHQRVRTAHSTEVSASVATPAVLVGSKTVTSVAGLAAFSELQLYGLPGPHVFTFANSVYGSATAQVVIRECGPGEKQVFAGNNSVYNRCENCVAGTYSQNMSVTQCTLCPPGTFAQSAGASRCEACAPGQAADRSGSSTCAACTAGTYAAASGAATCAACRSVQLGSFALAVGATACEKCATGFYYYPDTDVDYTDEDSPCVTLPALIAVLPVGGPTTGGTHVVVSVTNLNQAVLPADDDQVTKCRFGFTTVVATLDASAKTVTCAAPAAAAPSSVAVEVSLNGIEYTNSSVSTYLYYTPPTVAAVFPLGGPRSGGTVLSVSGSGLSSAVGALACLLGDDLDPSASLLSPTSAQCTAPAQATAGSVSLAMSLNGIDFSGATPFLYYDDPVVFSLSPVGGPLEGGTLVSLTGQDFVSGLTGPATTWCRFAGSATLLAPATVQSDSVVLCAAPALPLAQVATVSLSLNAVDFHDAGTYTYYLQATVSTIAPPGGPLFSVQPTLVTVTGSGFALEWASTLRCSFGGVVVSGTIKEATTVTCLSPDLAVGSVRVQVALNGVDFTVSTSSNFFHTYLLPNITQRIPEGGAASAGTPVQLLGTGFVDIEELRPYYACQFKDRLTSATFVDTTQMLCQAPNEEVGAVTIRVVLNGEAFPVSHNTPSAPYVFFNNSYLYDIMPRGGPKEGGTLVSVLGSGFGAYLGPDVVLCRIGGVVLPATVVSASVITCHSPAFDRPRLLPVEVTMNSVDYQLSPNDYQGYETPLLNSILPFGGPTTATMEVTVMGAGFAGLADESLINQFLRCRFGAVEVAATLIDASKIKCLAPQGLPEGPVDVQVSLNSVDFTAVLSDLTEYYYYTEPILTTLYPAGGPVLAGTQVTFVGSGFIDHAPLKPYFRCQFRQELVSAVYINTTAILCSAPAQAVGVAAVSLSLNAALVGSSASSVKYSYYAQVELWSMVPRGGPLEGGTRISITGTNFGTPLGPSLVVCRVGDVHVPGTMASWTVVVCVAPAYSARPVTLSVALNAVDFADAPSEYQYYVQPRIASVSPPGGVAAGGSRIVIGGGAFLEGLGDINLPTRGLTCRFDGAVMVDASFVDSNSVACVTPAAAVGAALVEVAINRLDFTATADAAVHTFYFYNEPVITSIFPLGGALTSGTLVTVTSADFVDNAVLNPLFRCQFRSTLVPAVDMVRLSPYAVACPAPIGAEGDAAVAVSMNGAAAPVPDSAPLFRYYVKPVITNFVPLGGVLEGGTTVTLHGSGFVPVLGEAAVICRLFDGDQALYAPLVIHSAQLATCVVPGLPVASASPGQALLAITLNLVDYEAAPFKWNYYSQVLVRSIYPHGGSYTRSTVLTVVGANFRAGLGGTLNGVVQPGLVCRFGNYSVPATMLDASAAECQAPSLLPSAVVVEVAVNGVDFTRTNQTGWTSTFYYFEEPIVTLLDPAGGPEAAGTLVHVHVHSFVDIPVLSNDFRCQFYDQLMPATIVDTHTVKCNAATRSAGSAVVLVSLNGEPYQLEPVVPLPTVENTQAPTPAPTLLITPGPTPLPSVAATPAPAPSTASNITAATPAPAASNSTAPPPSPVMPPTSNSSTATPTPSSNSSTPASTLAPAPANATTATPSPTASNTNGTNTTAPSPSRRLLQVPTPAPVPVAPSPAPTAAPLLSYVHYASPVLMSVNPRGGPTTGGTVLTITAQPLRGAFRSPLHASQVQCRVGNVLVPATVIDDFTVQCTTPGVASEQPVEVSVTLNGGADFHLSPIEYRYYKQAVLLDLLPPGGPVAGGTLLTLVGRGFQAGLGSNTEIDANAGLVCRFGDRASVQAHMLIDEGTMTVFSPELPTGSGGSLLVVEIAINGVDFTVSASNTSLSFLFYAQPRLLSDTAYPLGGPSSGGTMLSILGTNLFSDAQLSPLFRCRFGDAVAPTAAAVTVATGTVVCTSPFVYHTGMVEVAVAFNGVDWTDSFASFRYYTQVIIQSSPLPRGGPLQGGTLVTMMGDNIVSGLGMAQASCGFGSVITDVLALDPSYLVCSAPALDIPSKVPFRVSLNRVDYVEVDFATYTYYPQPSVAELFPQGGEIHGGTLLHVAGFGFRQDVDPVPVCFFGDVPILAEASSDEDNVYCVTPKAEKGAVNLTVSLNGGLDRSAPLTYTFFGFDVNLQLALQLSPEEFTPDLQQTFLTVLSARLGVPASRIRFTNVVASGNATRTPTPPTPSPTPTPTPSPTTAAISPTPVPMPAPTPTTTPTAANTTVATSNAPTTTNTTTASSSPETTATNSTTTSPSPVVAAGPIATNSTTAPVAPEPRATNSSDMPAPAPVSRRLLRAGFVLQFVIEDHYSLTSQELSDSFTELTASPESTAELLGPSIPVSPEPVPAVLGFDDGSVKRIDPPAGPTQGGTVVTVTGSGFRDDIGGLTCRFGENTNKYSVVTTFINATTILCMAPNITGAQVVNIEVSLNGAQFKRSIPAVPFTYYKQPTLEVLDPSSGSAVGAYDITVRGYGLSDVDASRLKAKFTRGEEYAKTACTFYHPTYVTCKAPAWDVPSEMAGRVVPVRVELTLNDAGPLDYTNSATVLVFSYYLEPTLVRVEPAMSGKYGGNQLTVYGTTFVRSQAEQTYCQFDSFHLSTLALAINSTFVVCETPVVWRLGRTTLTVLMNAVHRTPTTLPFAFKCGTGTFTKPLGIEQDVEFSEPLPEGVISAPKPGMDPACQSCPRGSYNPFLGMLECIPCPPGRARNAVLGRVVEDCAPCEDGWIAAEPGQLLCTQCGPLSMQNANRSACLCQQGAFGMFGVPLEECHECDPGVICDERGKTVFDLVTRPTYWRHSNLTSHIYACDNPDACLGGLYGGCAMAYEGPLCSVCQPGYGRAEATCVDCSEKPELNVLTVIIMPMLILYEIKSIVEASMDVGNLDAGIPVMMKILLDYLQITSLASSVGVSWSIGGVSIDPDSGAFQVGDTTVDFESLSVTTPGDYDDDAEEDGEATSSDSAAATPAPSGVGSDNGTAATTPPVAVTQRARVTSPSVPTSTPPPASAQSARVRRRQATAAGTLLNTTGSNASAAAFGNASNSTNATNATAAAPAAAGGFSLDSLFETVGLFSSPSAFVQLAAFDCLFKWTWYAQFMVFAFSPLACIAVPAALFLLKFVFTLLRLKIKAKKCYELFTVTTIVSLFLVYPSVTEKMFSTFDCQEVWLTNDHMVRYLTADRRIDCDSAEHQTFQLYAYVVLFTVGCGVPLLSALVIVPYRKKLKDEKTLTLYGFLYFGYRKKFFWWEAWISIRKFLIATVVFFLAGDTFNQIFCVIIILEAAILMQLRFRPYKNPFLNYMELASLLTASITLHSALFLLNSDREVPELLVGLMVVNILCVIYCYMNILNQHHEDIKDVWGTGKKHRMTLRNWVRFIIATLLATPVGYLTYVVDFAKKRRKAQRKKAKKRAKEQRKREAEAKGLEYESPESEESPDSSDPENQLRKIAKRKTFRARVKRLWKYLQPPDRSDSEEEDYEYMKKKAKKKAKKKEKRLKKLAEGKNAWDNDSDDDDDDAGTDGSGGGDDGDGEDEEDAGDVPMAVVADRVCAIAPADDSEGGPSGMDAHDPPPSPPSLPRSSELMDLELPDDDDDDRPVASFKDAPALELPGSDSEVELPLDMDSELTRPGSGLQEVEGSVAANGLPSARRAVVLKK